MTTDPANGATPPGGGLTPADEPCPAENVPAPADRPRPAGGSIGGLTSADVQAMSEREKLVLLSELTTQQLEQTRRMRDESVPWFRGMAAHIRAMSESPRARRIDEWGEAHGLGKFQKTDLSPLIDDFTVRMEAETLDLERELQDLWLMIQGGIIAQDLQDGQTLPPVQD